ncbi:MAG: glycosyltransferase family 4 protein [Rhodothermales bacterium]|nr:glycosyltransferase family 4 protein [Rhodothermales bacterium]
MHILCVYQHYANFDCANSGRLYTFLQHLSKRHQITLISSDHWYGRRLTDKYPWVPENVDWIPITVPYSNSMSSLQRMRSYAQFPLAALRRGRSVKADVVYGISTPLSTGWAARKLAATLDVPFVFEIRDLWPDFPVQMGAIRNRIIRNRLYRLEKDLYTQADHVITVAPDMTDHVTAHGVPDEKVTTLLQGTNLGLADTALHTDWKDPYDFGERKVVLYAGTFGRANAIQEILDVSRRLQDHKDILFAFTGGGYFESAIRQAEESSPNVKLLPPIPRHEIMHVFRRATLSIVPFKNLPVLATNSPAKLFDSLAVGTPVLVTNPGWTKRFVEDHECGHFAPIDRPDLIAETILTATKSSDTRNRMMHNGITVANRLFDRVEMAGQLEKIFMDITERQRRTLEQTN